MVVLSDLSRRFGPVRALRNVTLEIPDGTTVALLGPNGSGKSTLLRLVAGLLRPTAGAVSLNGKPPKQCKAEIGFLGHEPFLYRYLSAAENLRLYADLYRVDRSVVPGLLAQAGLERRAGALVRTFSRGEAQRLGLARALLHDPEYLLLDEPFAGLDELSSERLPELISRTGRTVLFSTHDRARAGQLADRCVSLEEGRIV